jgi:hypothetical protein
MAKTTDTKPTWVQAREAMVIILGARAPVYRTTIVRDRKSGRLAEVPLAPIEAPPIDEGSEGVSYAFAKGERVMSDHPAVAARPNYFVEADSQTGR